MLAEREFQSVPVLAKHSGIIFVTACRRWETPQDATTNRALTPPSVRRRYRHRSRVGPRSSTSRATVLSDIDRRSPRSEHGSTRPAPVKQGRCSSSDLPSACEIPDDDRKAHLNEAPERRAEIVVARRPPGLHLTDSPTVVARVLEIGMKRPWRSGRSPDKGLRLLEEVPNRVRVPPRNRRTTWTSGPTVTTCISASPTDQLRKESGRRCRHASGCSGPDKPENNQKATRSARKPPEDHGPHRRFPRENPEAGRRDIVAALERHAPREASGISWTSSMQPGCVYVGPDRWAPDPWT